MVQEETYKALLLVRQRDRDVNWSESQVIQISKEMFIAIFYQNYFHAIQDLINVLWHSVVSATLHTLVVHSMTMLLQTLNLDQAVKESLSVLDEVRKYCSGREIRFIVVIISPGVHGELVAVQH